jgi:type III pantothenate kinase
MESDASQAGNGPGRILACDVGNSRVKFGLFAVAGVARPALPVCLHSAAFSLADRVDWDRISGWLADDGESSFLAGSNPVAIERIQREWAEWVRRPPFEQVNEMCRLLESAVDAPRRVGVDRLLNAVAANVLRGPRQPAVIVDSGTATTIDFVDGRGVFRGGAILPGFELAAKSLHEYTALLPLVTVDELATEPRVPLGANTHAAICSGLYWGQVGAVRELAARLSEPRQANSPGDPPLILLSGGGAELLAEQFPAARWEPHLSLQGLVLAGTGLLRSTAK